MATERVPAVFYHPKVNNRNTETRCEICSKLITKTPQRPQWLHSGVFIVNFEHISLLLFEHFIAVWDRQHKPILGQYSCFLPLKTVNQPMVFLCFPILYHNLERESSNGMAAGNFIPSYFLTKNPRTSFRITVHLHIFLKQNFTHRKWILKFL